MDLLPAILIDSHTISQTEGEILSIIQEAVEMQRPNMNLSLSRKIPPLCKGR